MKVEVCGSCGILWSRKLRTSASISCPNCGHGISKEVDTAN